MTPTPNSTPRGAHLTARTGRADRHAARANGPLHGTLEMVSRSMPPRPRVHNGVACLVALALTQPAAASLFGRDGFSGNPDTNAGAVCTVCHAPGAPMPSVTISGPDGPVEAGSTVDLRVTISGGPTASAGIGVSVSEFAGELIPNDAFLQRQGNELVHTEPKPFGAGSVDFDLRWQAPEFNGAFEIFVAANSTNGQTDLLGDGIATGRIAVDVVGGGDPPPPPPPPPPATIALNAIATGLASPVGIAHAGDERLFIVEKAGRIRIVDGNGELLATPFLDIRDRVDAGGSELGLLGLAFHPDYPNNGEFFVNYTRDPGPGLDRTRIARFKVSADPNLADADSEEVVLEYEQPFANHNGGDIHTGPDGFLYIASGDGGSGGDPQDNAQNPSRLLGKILRIDVDGPDDGAPGPDCDASGAGNYGIPSGNAFRDGPGGAGCDEIYITGLRNPWRMRFDAATGDLWIGDVGQNAFEEIDFIPAGAGGGLNLGWRCFEGFEPFNPDGCDRDYFEPVHAYSHDNGNCSITGGAVYRGSDYPILTGRYFFTDFCNPSIRTLTGLPDAQVEVVLEAGNISVPSSFGEDYRGELYVTSLNDGTLYRIEARPLKGDANGDGSIDRIDVVLVWKARGTPADGEDDPRDFNSDGFITPIDAILVALNCTERGCTVN